MNLSQEEIEALLNATSNVSDSDDDASGDNAASTDESEALNEPVGIDESMFIDDSDMPNIGEFELAASDEGEGSGVDAPSTGGITMAQIAASEDPNFIADNDPEKQRTADGGVARGDYILTGTQVDTLGEVGNICMGAVATTMYTLLDKRVAITTPRLSVHTTKEVLSMYAVPFVVVEVEYVEGVDGKNLLLLKEPDAALITDLLMGGDGNIEEPIELSELHMSAISEITNQMIGASATALSKILNAPINISPPVSNRVDVNTDVGFILNDSEMVIKVSFDMEIEGLLKSQLLQIIPFSVGVELVNLVTSYVEEEEVALPAHIEAEIAAAPVAAEPVAEPIAAPVPPANYPGVPPAAYPELPPTAYPGVPPAAYPEVPPYPAPPYPYPYPPQQYPGYPGYPGYAPAAQSESFVDVRPMQFGSFDSPSASPQQGTIELVSDIPLQVSVELGKTRKQISEILDFGMGTIIVLDKIAGDPVEILVNGKLIARGEVVVIDENYGVRITEIVGTM